MEKSELDNSLQKKTSVLKIFNIAYYSCVAFFFCSIIGMVVTYFVSKNKADAVNAVQKLSTTEQRELLNSYLKTPMTILIIILLVAVVGFFLFRALRVRQLRSKYEIEYEMKDSIPKLEK